VDLDLENLGSSGFYRLELDGEYDSLDHEVSMLVASDIVVDCLLHIEYPEPPALPVANVHAGCGDTLASKSGRMFTNEVDACDMPDGSTRAETIARRGLPR
jgi:hypothetical protein